MGWDYDYFLTIGWELDEEECDAFLQLIRELHQEKLKEQEAEVQEDQQSEGEADDKSSAKRKKADQEIDLSHLSMHNLEDECPDEYMEELLSKYGLMIVWSSLIPDYDDGYAYHLSLANDQHKSDRKLFTFEKVQAIFEKSKVEMAKEGYCMIRNKVLQSKNKPSITVDKIRNPAIYAQPMNT